MERSRFWKSFGPGLLWAATAIGVSHLVQSTRAGADAGFGLVVVILVALALKYPFFEFGSRYAAATGESLVEGYRRIGAWALWLYMLITAVTAVIVQAAVLVFTGFLLLYMLGAEWSLVGAVALVYAASALLLRIGRFRAYDVTVKTLMAVLAVTTLIAAAVALPRADLSSFTVWPGGAGVSLAFVIALVGWMPAGMDVAAWSSLWTLAKDDAAGVRTDRETARLDFLIGYIGTTVLALAFVVLGAAVMHRSGESFSAAGPAFATQLVDLYARTLGEWTRPLIVVAAFTTMLTTAITVIDGFPRAIDRSVRVLRAPALATVVRSGVTGRVYWVAVGTFGLAVIIVSARFTGSLAGMVDLATTVSFLTAPVLAWLTLRAMTGAIVPPEHRPGPLLRSLAYVGIVLLAGTGLIYLAGFL